MPDDPRPPRDPRHDEGPRPSDDPRPPGDSRPPGDVRRSGPSGDGGHPPVDVHPLDDPADAAALAGHAATLAEAVAAAIPGWVRRSVERTLAAQGMTPDTGVAGATGRAAEAAAAEGDRRVRDLLATDIDRQVGNPLAVLRSLVRYPTEVLRAAGARPVPRDEFRERVFPDDVYDLSPASFADVDPALHEPGLVWGAAKAHVHLARRRREGRR